MRLRTIALCCLLGLGLDATVAQPVQAGYSQAQHAPYVAVSKTRTELSPQLYFSFNIGANQYKELSNDDNASALLRLAIGKWLLVHPRYRVGFELGAQTGNRLKIHLPPDELATMGAVPLYVDNKNFLDALVATQLRLDFIHNDLSIVLKAGVAVRPMQYSYYSTRQFFKTSPEVMLGLRYTLNTITHISLLGQAILDEDIHYIIDAENYDVKLSGVPDVHSIMLGITIDLYG